jgi:uncharacterized protein
VLVALVVAVCVLAVWLRRDRCRRRGVRGGDRRQAHRCLVTERGHGAHQGLLELGRHAAAVDERVRAAAKQANVARLGARALTNDAMRERDECGSVGPLERGAVRCTAAGGDGYDENDAESAHTGIVRFLHFRAVDAWRQPSLRLLKLRRLEVGAATLLVAVALGLLAISSASAGVAGVFAATACGAVAERIATRRFHAWGYAERDDDLLVRRGVMFSRLSVVPYGRMQFIDVTAGPLERSFGLATVRMHTAAAASDARIPGLERAEAERLRDRLAELGESQAAGI